MFLTLRYVFKILFFIVISLYALVWLLSPWAVNHYLAQYLQTHDLLLGDESSIRYNPFRSRLEINTLTVTAPTVGTVSEVTFFSLEVDLHQLIFDDIYIPKVAAEGVNITIRKTHDDLLVGGFSLAKFKSNRPLASQSGSSRAKGLNFLSRIVMPELILKKSSIDFFNDQAQHTLKLHNINITDLLATSQKQTVGISIVGDLDGGAVDINATADLLNKEGGIDFEVNVTDIDVERFNQFLPKEVDKLLGTFSYYGKHRLNIEGESIILKLDSGSFISSDVHLEKDDLHLLVGQQETSIENFSFTLEKDKIPKAEGRASVKINNVSIYNKDESLKLGVIKQLALDSVVLFHDEQAVQKIRVAQIDLLDGFFSDDQADLIPALIAFKGLVIQEVGLSKYGIEIGDITLAGLVANAELDSNKKIKNLLVMPNTDNKALVLKGGSENVAEDSQTAAIASQTVITESATDNKTVFKVKLNALSLADKGEIFFLDNSVNPVYQQHVAINEFVAGPFDNANPDQESVITVAGNSDRYARFSFITKAKPFLEKPTYKIAGSLKEFSLPGLSSYIKQVLQYEIESGQLDLDVNVQLVGTTVDGEVEVMLRGIELSSADDFEVSSINDQILVPFNMALGMLKDSDGNVELSLPITGDTRSPSFGLSGFVTLLVKKATILGARDYLVTTFVPYAQVVNIAVLAGGYALKVRVNDLPYNPEQVDLLPEQKEFLEQFSALLKDRESTQIKLCAVATAKDIGKLAGSDLTSVEDRKRLNEISTQRVSIFKAYMIEKENVPSSRLLLCTPQIDSSKDAVSRLSFKT